MFEVALLMIPFLVVNSIRPGSPSKTSQDQKHNFTDHSVFPKPRLESRGCPSASRKQRQQSVSSCLPSAVSTSFCIFRRRSDLQLSWAATRLQSIGRQRLRHKLTSAHHSPFGHKDRPLAFFYTTLKHSTRSCRSSSTFGMP